jgi:hypothetical protein
MSRMTIVLSAATFLCASSQIALADESGAITGGVGGAVAGAVVGGPDQQPKTRTPEMIKRRPRLNSAV